MSTYQIKLNLLTALHIGTGIELSPLEYVIRDNVLHAFSTSRVVNSLDSETRQIFLKAIDQNEWLTIRAIINEHATAYHDLYSIPVTEAVAKQYGLRKNDTDNQLLVKKIYRDPSSSTPVIPGSSIKGAMRTALVSELGLSLGNKDGLGDPRRHEQVVLGFNNAKVDPFRGLRIEDCAVLGKSTQKVDDFIHFKPQASQGNHFTSIQLFCEYLRGELDGGDSHGTFAMGINLDWAKKGQLTYSLRDLFTACNRFYVPHFQAESERFYSSTGDSTLQGNINRLLERINKLNENECLVRIGRFSHAENVTVDRFRDPKARKGWGKSRTLSESKLPLGWTIFSCSEKDLSASPNTLPDNSQYKDRIQLFPAPRYENREKLHQSNHGEMKSSDQRSTSRGQALAPGTVVKGKIHFIRPFGVNVWLDNGARGMVHKSRFHDKNVTSFKEGMEIKLRIIKVKANGEYELDFFEPEN
ncbi:MAG TPA: S1 RNA-binding domain-containing protein [Desulfobacteraceae bacterium]|nr:S1 RNA-binding domain-containing protein [Desulfobacteraceae bacterium]